MIDAAERMLGDSVAIYLDGGPVDVHDGFEASTGLMIVDATGLSDGGKLRIVRHGVIPDEEIIRVVGADLVARSTTCSLGAIAAVVSFVIEPSSSGSSG